MTNLHSTACILLAAGRSARFGLACKLSRPWQGKALGDHVSDRLAALPFGAHIAVVRAGGFVPADPVYRAVCVADATAGIAHSIATGIRAIADDGFSAALIVLADMPLVPEAHLLSLIRHFDGDVAASKSGGRKQVPALFDAAHFPALMALEGDIGAAALLKNAAAVDADPAWLRDFDKPEDFG